MWFGTAKNHLLNQAFLLLRNFLLRLKQVTSELHKTDRLKTKQHPTTTESTTASLLLHCLLGNIFLGAQPPQEKKTKQKTRSQNICLPANREAFSTWEVSCDINILFLLFTAGASNDCQNKNLYSMRETCCLKNSSAFNSKPQEDGPSHSKRSPCCTARCRVLAVGA